MTEIDKDLLKELYDAYLKGDRTFKFYFPRNDLKEEEETRNSLQNLEEQGYIRLKAKALGSVIAEFTDFGLNYAENNFN